MTYPDNDIPSILDYMKTLFIKFLQAIKSKTVWTAVILWLVTNQPQVKAVVPIKYQSILDAVLVLLIAIFHIHPSQPYGQDVN